MKAKTPGEVIRVLKDEIRIWKLTPWRERHRITCLNRAIGIVRLWDAGITPADVRKAGRKGRVKK